ncbi:hypothetical protein [Bacillus sp. ISL-57]|uniref:hypothetical protein n=1 Tax=Bacillus sp. ISL-57 TaxID=2819135 RepID=UPI001BE9BE1D|nr:hypothetical protein [Bacillus sp. ISL-57]MBT2716969.1 hypothetical protein [Bacillus sp. ISL-57]
MERLCLKGLDIKKVQYSDSYEHLLQRYPSANSNMDHYVITHSKEDKDNGKGLTFLFVSEDEEYLYGYYSLFATSIVYADDESDEFVGIPSIELKLFAINNDLSGKGFVSSIDGKSYKYSDMLLASIIADIKYYSDELIGIQAIVLRSTKKALNFYLGNNFSEFSDYLNLPYDGFSKKCIHLILPL